MTGHGSTIGSNLMTPVVVFYYNGTAWVYSYHDIEKFSKLWGGMNKIGEHIKSLCLYYFDDNISDPNDGFVVDAKEYKANDYPLDSPIDPSEKLPEGLIDKNVVDMYATTGVEFKNVDQAITEVKKILNNEKGPYKLYDENIGNSYIGGCYLPDINFLSVEDLVGNKNTIGDAIYTFISNIGEDDIDKLNEFLKNWKFAFTDAAN